MKILITGCNGQLGTELQAQLRRGESELGPIPDRLKNATVLPVDVDQLDITDRAEVVNFVRRHQPDTIINCAAFTNVDGCETSKDAAFKVNALGPRNLAIAADKINARLIHVSTDYVFSGEGTPRWMSATCPPPAAPTAPPSCWASSMCSGSAAATSSCVPPGCMATTARTSSRP